MANAQNTTTDQITAALSKGPIFGPPVGTQSVPAYIFDEVVSAPVGTVTSAQYLRFGMIPKGARIIRVGSYLSTDHTATVSGKLQFVPIDGAGSTQEITSVVANLEATETTSVPDAANTLVIEKDSWVQFVPGADLTIASSAKNFWLRLLYSRAG